MNNSIFAIKRYFFDDVTLMEDYFMLEKEAENLTSNSLLSQSPIWKFTARYGKI